MKNIYHLIESVDWLKAKELGRLAPASLISEGFVHCSFLHQLQATANRHYPRAVDLLALEVSVESLGEHLVIEDTSGHGEFPHIYRAIELDDVCAIHEMLKKDNSWRSWE